MATTTKRRASAPSYDLDLLAKIVSATQSGGFLYVADFDSGPLVSGGFAEVNEGMADGEGKKATRATPAGIALAPATPTAGLAETAASAPANNDLPKVKIRTGLVMPEKKRAGRGREAKYAFASLTEVGHGFHVPATEAMPQPWRTLQSTVSAANMKYAVEKKDASGNVIMEQKTVSLAQRDGQGKVITDAQGKIIRRRTLRSRPVYEHTRRFAVYQAPDGDPDGPGAIIQRIA